jgi:hypothetical protein
VSLGALGSHNNLSGSVGASLTRMFTRVRWFAIGAASTIGAGMYLAGRVKVMREKITAETMTRAGAVTAAGMMEAAGRRLQTGNRIASPDPEGSATGEG